MALAGAANLKRLHFRDPGSPNSSKPEKPTETPEPRLFSLLSTTPRTRKPPMTGSTTTRSACGATFHCQWALTRPTQNRQRRWNHRQAFEGCKRKIQARLRAPVCALFTRPMLSPYPVFCLSLIGLSIPPSSICRARQIIQRGKIDSPALSKL